MKNFLTTVQPYFLRFLLNSRCVLCFAPADTHELCESCLHDMPYFPIEHQPEFCPKCKEPTQNFELCDYCVTYPTHFDETVPVFKYEFPLDALIPQFKYAKNLATGTLIAHLMSDYYKKHYNIHQKPLPEVLIPLPLHDTKLKSRGFNQALELAKHLGKNLNIPVNHKICKRIKQTEVQASLHFADRLKNMSNAFEIMHQFKSSIENKHVAIVDDVMTTGATLREISSLLKHAGAKSISLWVIARALPENYN